MTESFCTTCGYAVTEEHGICTKCGTPISPPKTMSEELKPKDDDAELSQEEKAIRRDFAEQVARARREDAAAKSHPSPPKTAEWMSEGTRLIADERDRQRKAEGWTPEHDDTHNDGEMRLAAVAYAYHISSLHADGTSKRPPSMWPWRKEWWKPSPDPVRQLTKAGALIAAEIDRLLRLREKEGKWEETKP